ncbi:MAG: hypothetical protein IH964_02345 [Candidatus Dadabacteria bacterium]|nr:hypothetical protein [Candidatus Dadabacteria bacterium]
MLDYKIKPEGPFTLFDIVDIAKSEFSKGDMALGLYTEIINSFFWLCSNQDVAAQIKKDYSFAITFTLDEMIKFLKDVPRVKKINSRAMNFHNN